jgi:Carboxypeptidase regulatory-like domain
LTGVVTDPTGGGIPRATVKAFDATGTLIAQALANESGAYEIASLPDGPIRLQAEAAGFSSTEIGDLLASAQKPIQQDIRLNVGSVSETIQVQAGAPGVVNTESSSVAAARNAGSGKQLGSGSGLGSAISGKRAGGGFGTASGSGRESSYLIDAARAGAEAAARSEALGDLFEYKNGRCGLRTLPASRSMVAALASSKTIHLLGKVFSIPFARARSACFRMPQTWR